MNFLNNIRQRQNVWASILIAGIIFLAFFPVLQAEILSWDDGAHLVYNQFIYSLNFENLIKIFKQSVNKTYIPLTTLSFAIEYHFFKFNAAVYHLTNLLLHIFNTILVLAIVRRMDLSFRAAVFVALLFGLHPMRVESVAWITERKDVLYAAFYLMSIYSYIGFVKEKKRGMYLWSLCFGVLSILSKPMALSLPLILLLYDWFFKRPWSWRLIVFF